MADRFIIMECKYAGGECVQLRKDDHIHSELWNMLLVFQKLDTNNHQG